MAVDACKVNKCESVVAIESAGFQIASVHSDVCKLVAVESYMQLLSCTTVFHHEVYSACAPDSGNV